MPVHVVNDKYELLKEEKIVGKSAGTVPLLFFFYATHFRLEGIPLSIIYHEVGEKVEGELLFFFFSHFVNL